MEQDNLIGTPYPKCCTYRLGGSARKYEFQRSLSAPWGMRPLGQKDPDMTEGTRCLELPSPPE